MRNLQVFPTLRNLREAEVDRRAVPLRIAPTRRVGVGPRRKAGPERSAFEHERYGHIGRGDWTFVGKKGARCAWQILTVHHAVDSATRVCTK
jgi:hypothetical protein